MKKRIVITGGPCSGKTSIIEELKENGYHCFDEVSREIIQSMNIKTAFKSVDFEETVFGKRKTDYLNAPQGTSFFDRSMLDNIAYLKKNKHHTPNHFIEDCKSHRYYTRVFITTPWKEIYHKDNERLEDFEEAIRIFEALKEVYTQFNYNLIELPQLTNKERIAFIFNKI